MLEAGLVGVGTGYQGEQKVLRQVEHAAFGEGFSQDDAHVMMLVLEQQHPEWFSTYENVLGDVLLGARDELVSALASAPDPFLAGMTYMALVMRIQLAQVTGRKDA